MNSLSTIRAYVGGEAFWSKGQKDAIYFLTRYTVSHQEEEYLSYLENIKIPLGDKIARIELQKSSSNLDVADAGFIQGKNHPDDVRAMSNFFKRFYWVSYLQKTIDIWTKGDAVFDTLQSLGNKLHEQISKNKISAEDTRQALIKIDNIDKEITSFEDQYSYTLGGAARKLTSVLYFVTFFMAFSFLMIGLTVSYTILKNILKNIDAIKLGTIRIEQGNLSTPIKISSLASSQDELNQLAHSFNKMTDGLRRAVLERDSANENLKLRARQLSEAQELAQMGNWEWDIRNNMLDSSYEIYRILGVDPNIHELNLEFFQKRINLRDSEAIVDLVKKSLSDIKPFSIDCKIDLENNDLREVHIQGRVILDDFGTPVKLTGYLQDITERYKIQSALIQSSKMASLGEMAGGIAHEINNPLTIIKLAAAQLDYYIKSRPPDMSLLKQSISKIDNTVDRISSIITGLRTFSRDGRGDPFEVVSVAELLNSTLSFCNERLRLHAIKLIKDAISESLFFEGRQVEISQVILNLLNNSIDAIEFLDDKWIKISVLSQDNFIEIRIIDSGSGIPLEIQEKMFQPFFTSKEIGKGTGFGLSLSLTIMKSHHGELLYDKNYPNTCFILRLPMKQTMSIS